MVRLKMHGFYDKIIDHAYVESEGFIDCYDDSAVQNCDTLVDKSIALMIEPRSIMPRGYEFLENGGWKRFKYVFTHDSKLLKELPNARLIYVGTVWYRSDVPKTKHISLVCSFKKMCELHKLRKELAYFYEDAPYVDVFGDYKYHRQMGWVEPEKYLRDYRYSIVVENYIDDFYFTEKILNCFANKVIPIYIGARRIGTCFESNGIVQICNPSILPEYVDSIIYGYGSEAYYESKREYIEVNYEISKKYDRFENWFFKTYEKLLSEMM